MSSEISHGSIQVILALGANLGAPLDQLDGAVRQLRDFVRIDAVSDVYRTEPVGRTDQPDFYNLVLTGRTDATVFEVHLRGHGIERGAGRIRTAANEPRAIDVDLIAYGHLVYTSESLTVPHPRMSGRSFVLAPLSEIAPSWRHPLDNRSAAESLGRLVAPTRVERLGPLQSLV